LSSLWLQAFSHLLLLAAMCVSDCFEQSRSKYKNTMEMANARAGHGNQWHDGCAHGTLKEVQATHTNDTFSVCGGENIEQTLQNCSKEPKQPPLLEKK